MTIVIIMGVSGCGKSTIGRQLAAELGWAFVDADDFHSPESKAKMQQGKALSDDDRAPWLSQLNQAIRIWHQHQPTILACSALKASHRQQLSPPEVAPQWIYLHGTYEQIKARLVQRQQSEPEHFMGAGLLQSQFEALEEPEEALWISVTRSPDAIVTAIKQAFDCS